VRSDRDGVAVRWPEGSSRRRTARDDVPGRSRSWCRLELLEVAGAGVEGEPPAAVAAPAVPAIGWGQWVGRPSVGDVWTSRKHRPRSGVHAKAYSIVLSATPGTVAAIVQRTSRRTPFTCTVADMPAPVSAWATSTRSAQRDGVRIGTAAGCVPGSVRSRPPGREPPWRRRKRASSCTRRCTTVRSDAGPRWKCGNRRRDARRWMTEVALSFPARERGLCR
jgi:hypothetical protein